MVQRFFFSISSIYKALQNWLWSLSTLSNKDKSSHKLAKIPRVLLRDRHYLDSTKKVNLLVMFVAFINM